MHYIYSQSLVVGALINAWDSMLLTPRQSPVSCSDFLLIGRQACTSKGIPLPTFSYDLKGELDEIILCTSELIVANLNHIKLNTCSDTINNIKAMAIELDKPGLEIISDGLRLLRRDMEGMRYHFLSQFWLEHGQLGDAYEHVDVLLGFIDQALHGDADTSSYNKLLERYKQIHSKDHFGQAHINFYAIDSEPQEGNKIDIKQVKDELAVVAAVVFDDGEQTIALHNESVFALNDNGSHVNLNQTEHGLQSPCPPTYSSITKETNESYSYQNNECKSVSLETASNDKVITLNVDDAHNLTNSNSAINLLNQANNDNHKLGEKSSGNNHSLFDNDLINKDSFDTKPNKDTEELVANSDSDSALDNKILPLEQDDKSKINSLSDTKLQDQATNSAFDSNDGQNDTYDSCQEVMPKPKRKENFNFSVIKRLFSKKYHTKAIKVKPSNKVRLLSSQFITLALILGLTLMLWGGVNIVSYFKLSSLGTTVEAKIVAIEDDYVHKKESRYLERLEHHFVEIVEFKINDNETIKTPLYLDSRLDSSKVRPIGTKITVLYKNGDPHCLVDYQSITPLYASIATLILGLIITIASIFFLVILNLRFFRHEPIGALKSGVVSFLIMGISLIGIGNYFDSKLHWLYQAAHEEDVLFDEKRELLIDKSSNRPYTGLLRTFDKGISTITPYNHGLKNGTEYLYVATKKVGYFNYVKGKLDGPFVAIDEYGRKSSRGNYRSGHLDGKWTKFEAVNGNIVAKGQYLWGAKEGTWTFFRSDGSKYCVENYAQGKLDGKYYEYGPLGQLILKTRYVNDVAHGKITRFWPNGTKLYQANLKNGIANGLFNAYYSSGTLFVSGMMKFGCWYEPPKVYNHRGIELDSAQKRLYRKSKDKQISTIKRAIALDYNLTFDEVGLATSIYKFRIGNDAFNYIDNELVSEYAKFQGTQDFTYFALPKENENDIKNFPNQTTYSDIRAKGEIEIPASKEFSHNRTREFSIDEKKKQKQDESINNNHLKNNNAPNNNKKASNHLEEADPFSTDSEALFKDSAIDDISLNAWYSNNPNFDQQVILEVNQAPNLKVDFESDLLAQIKGEQKNTNLLDSGVFSDSYNLLHGPISNLDRQIHESILQAEVLGQNQALSQTIASNTKGKTLSVHPYTMSNRNITYKTNSKEEISLKEYTFNAQERSVNLTIDSNKEAQLWGQRNIQDAKKLAKQYDSRLDKESASLIYRTETLRDSPANRPSNADALNNDLLPFDLAIKDLMLIALHNWVGQSLFTFSGMHLPFNQLVQYGDGFYKDTSFAWMRYPDYYMITVTISKPQLQSSSTLVRGFEKSDLRFDPYQLIYQKLARIPPPTLKRGGG